jgi:hypothetical protein
MSMDPWSGRMPGSDAVTGETFMTLQEQILRKKNRANENCRVKKSL